MSIHGLLESHFEKVPVVINRSAVWVFREEVVSEFTYIPFHTFSIPFLELIVVTVGFLLSFDGQVHIIGFSTVAAHCRLCFQVSDYVRISCQCWVKYVIFPSSLICKLSKEVGTDKVQHGIVELHRVVGVWAH